MLTRVNRVARLQAAVAASCSAAFVFAITSSAFADGDRPDRSRRWVPSIALTGGGGFQDVEAAQMSMCETGGVGDPLSGIQDCIGPSGGATPGPAPLRRPESGSDHSVFPFVGATLQLSSPSIEFLPGRPSVFVSGELNLVFPPVRNVVNEANAGTITIPPDVTSGLMGLPATGLQGVGSRTSSEIRTVRWGAGAGLAFPFEFLGRQLRVKPSANWTHFEVDVEGLLVAGLKDDPMPGFGPPFSPNLRDVTLEGRSTIVVDGIGPGLELEMDVGDIGPFGASVFINANGYRVLGDRDTRIAVTCTPPDPACTGSYLTVEGLPDGIPVDTYTAEWSYEVDPWLYDAEVGLRFSFIGN